MALVLAGTFSLCVRTFRRRSCLELQPVALPLQEVDRARNLLGVTRPPSGRREATPLLLCSGPRR